MQITLGRQLNNGCVTLTHAESEWLRELLALIRPIQMIATVDAFAAEKANHDPGVLEAIRRQLGRELGNGLVRGIDQGALAVRTRRHPEQRDRPFAFRDIQATTTIHLLAAIPAPPARMMSDPDHIPRATLDAGRAEPFVSRPFSARLLVTDEELGGFIT